MLLDTGLFIGACIWAALTAITGIGFTAFYDAKANVCFATWSRVYDLCAGRLRQSDSGYLPVAVPLLITSQVVLIGVYAFAMYRKPNPDRERPKP